MTTSEASLQPPTLLSVNDLTLDVTGPDGLVPILLGVDFTLEAGEALGIVGESGSGKSMTLRCVNRLEPEGSVIGGNRSFEGTRIDDFRGAQLREYRRHDVATIFQDPRSAINPLQRIDTFLLEATKAAHADMATARDSALTLLTRMGVSEPARRMRQYPHELSGGLLQRVMIASVLLANPRLILADEPTTALDVTTQSDVLAITDELRREQGTALLFVTHDLDLALAICDRVAVLYAGRVLEMADASTMHDTARHPYTRGLLASRPPLDHRVDHLPAIEGRPVAARDTGSGCPFYSRCTVHIDRCREELPAMTPYAGGEVRCHRSEEVAAGLLDGVPAGSTDSRRGRHE